MELKATPMQTIPPHPGSSKPPSQRTQARRRREPAQTLTPLQRFNRRPILVLSTQPTFPLWLKVLISLKQGVALTLLLSVVAMLAAYTWVADTQRLWGQNYQQLRQMERKERQLHEANESLRGHFVDISQQNNADLVPINPANAIFLKAAESRPLDRADEPEVKRNFSPAAY